MGEAARRNLTPLEKRKTAQAANSPPTTVVILVWLWTIRRPFVDLLNQPASHKSKGPFLDFRDPWGNRIEIVGYDNVQFTKAPNVLRGMDLAHLTKNEKAQRELAEKGMAVGQGDSSRVLDSTDPVP